MRQIGSYQIIELLGKGGMGEVYLAEDMRLGRKVALKLLHSELTINAPLVLRFQQEARTASALNHPNILTIFDIGEVESTHFIATEFVKGETLRACMSSTRMNVQKALNIVIQVANALGAAHEVGVVHRDIKPENIMVRPDGLVKVLDFGIAKLTQRIATSTEMGLLPLVNTEPGILMGTPTYMSPEQMRGLEVDERTDIFSLGVVLYEMLTGTPPFEAATIGDMIIAILQNEPPPIAQHTEGVPSGLQQIVDKALRKNRDERYQTMADLISDLRGQGRSSEVDQQINLPIWSGATTIVGAATELAIVATRKDPEDRSDASRATRTASSAEYIVSEIKQHKRGAALIVALVLVTAAVAGYVSHSAPSKSMAAINSVAVLPFENVGNDPNTEFLSDGISESLINNLCRMKQLKVSARSSSFTYKGKQVDLQEVARTLGVQAIVTGRIMRQGDQLQVSAELADTRDKTIMWGQQYNRKATDLLAVQSQISQQIAEKLRLRLTNAEQQQIVNDAKGNPEAYDLVLQGRFYGKTNRTEGLKKYVEYCNKAIAVDPSYALAYAGLADAYQLLSYDFPSDASKAEAAAQRAVQLDDTLAEAHYSLAQLKADGWDWIGAERENKRAIELNPSLAKAHAGYATYLDSTGRHEEGLAEIKRARELDPLEIPIVLYEGIILYNMRKYDQAIEQYTKALELNQNFQTTHECLGYAYSMKEMYAEAIAEYKEAIRLTEGDNTSAQIYMGYALAMSGNRKVARDILHKLKMTKEGVSSAELAVLYAGLGEKQQALASLEKAFDKHDLQLQFLKVEPHYDSLRSDPRFTNLLRNVGLTP